MKKLLMATILYIGCMQTFADTCPINLNDKDLTFSHGNYVAKIGDICDNTNSLAHCDASYEKAYKGASLTKIFWTPYTPLGYVDCRYNFNGLEIIIRTTPDVVRPAQVATQSWHDLGGLGVDCQPSPPDPNTCPFRHGG